MKMDLKETSIWDVYNTTLHMHFIKKIVNKIEKMQKSQIKLFK